MKRLFILLLLTHLFSYSMLTKISNNSIFKPHTIRDVELYHSQDGFQIAENGHFTRVHPHNIDKTVRSITPTQLAAFQEAGILRLTKANNGDYIVRAHVGGKGGGPILAGLFYGGTKAICYGTALAAGTAAVSGVVIASGASAPVAMAGAYVLKTAAAGATMGTSVAAAGIGTGVGTAAAATATAGVAVASGGSIATAVTLVESAATVAWWFGMAIPWF